MARNRKGFGFWIIVLVVVFAVGVLSKITNGFSDGVKSFSLLRNGEDRIYNNTSGLVFGGQEQFEITNYTTTSKDFSVKIYAYGGTEGTEDFQYQYGSESGYSWRAFAEEERKDLTACFNVKVIENRIIIEQEGGIYGVMQKYDENMTLPQSIPTGDRFTLEVTVGDSTIEIGFSLEVSVSSVTIDTTTIIF